MITSARIAALNRLEDGTQRPDAYGWITGTQVIVPMLTEPTRTQRQAFSLLRTAIPLTLK